MIGEEFLLGRAIDALQQWFQKKKEQKERVREILMSLKSAINKVVLHMDLSKEYGCINYHKLKIYLPADIEYLFATITKYQNDLDVGLVNSLYAFQKTLLNYNEFINSMGLGAGEELDKMESEIMHDVMTLDSEITKMVTELDH